ncbi:unnamed protein product [Cuscuta epithymum]|nr:unnamed protein product [Cuscuta epithymum]
MMASSFISCHHTSSFSPSTLFYTRRRSVPPRVPPPQCSRKNSSPFRLSVRHIQADEEDDSFSSLKKCAISLLLAAGFLLSEAPGNAIASYPPAFPDLAVLISGPPVKDPGALLRYALPIDNKAIREVQRPLEDITESLKLPRPKSLDSAERNVKQASRALKQGMTLVISGLAKSKVEHGTELLSKLEAGLNELERIIVEDKNRDAVAPKQKELLKYVGG